MDALSSFASREKKLQILKDPNAGAFAVIYCGLWYFLYFGALTELDAAFYVILPGFVLSRALSALAVVNFRSAKEDGMGAHEKKNANRKAVTIAMIFWILAAGALMVWQNPVCGAVGIAAAGLSFLYYRVKSYRQFGGFTGDLAGWFLQISELAVCLSAVPMLPDGRCAHFDGEQPRWGFRLQKKVIGRLCIAVFTQRVFIGEGCRDNQQKGQNAEC